MKSPKAQLNLEAWLKEKARDILVMSKRGEDFRVQTTVSLTRRFRAGPNLSDAIGFFVRGGTGAWRGDSLDDDLPPMKTINIVKPTVKNNMSALSSARVAVKNEAANKQPSLRGAANVCDGITKFLDEDEAHWSGNLESRINQLSQTGYGYFIQTIHNPKKQSPHHAVTQDWQESEMSMPGEYACGNCGARGPFDAQSDADQIPCPKCKSPSEVVKPGETAKVPMPNHPEPFNPGDSETRVSTCLEHRIDERRSQAGNMMLADWFEHHYLVTEENLEADFPGFDFGQASDWSYSLKWKWALETGEDVFANSNYESEDYRKRYERRDIYLRPDEYETRIEPEDYTLRDGQGNVVFEIKRGERLMDKQPEGFCYSVVSEKIAPYWRLVDFRREWSYGCYMPDANSFWGQPLVELLQLQDDWNNLYTIQNQHLERNSINQITYNAMVYDADSWEQDLVPTAEGWTQPDNVDLGHYAKQIQALPLTGVTEGLKFLFQILPYVGGAPPETIGMRPPGTDTYHAQALRKQQSLGQLQPPGESKANCKVAAYRNHYKIAQDTWPEERFQYLQTRYGEEWKPDDIEAFLNADLDRDVVTSFIEGSEVPTDLIQKRMDMEQVISKYIEVKQIPPADIMRQYFDLMGIDYDMGGIEADNRLADARYEKIKQGLQVLGARGVSSAPTMAPDPQSGQMVPGPSLLVQGVMAHPGLQVKPRENHEEHINFYVAKEKALMSDELPNEPLIECCDIMIQRHEEAEVAQTQNAGAMQVARAAPVAAAQAAMESANQPPATPVADPQAEVAQQQVEADRQAQQTAQEREHTSGETDVKHVQEHAILDKKHAQERELKRMELESKERLAEKQGAQQERLAKEAAKQKAKQPKAA